MTLLQPATPTISADDNFRITYLGTYGDVQVDKANGKIFVERVKGPLPKNRFVWDAKDYLGGMEKGESRLVPFDLIRVYFGDPRSTMGVQQRTEDRRGNKGDIAPRENEIRRLSVLYGLYEGEVAQLGNTVPDVKITTADDEEILTPSIDPDGEFVAGHMEEEGETHDLATNITRMKRQIAALEAQAEAEKAKGGKNDGGDVAEDGPPVK